MVTKADVRLCQDGGCLASLGMWAGMAVFCLGRSAIGVAFVFAFMALSLGFVTLYGRLYYKVFPTHR